MLLKRIEKIIRERAFDKKEKKPGLKFNPEIALTGVRTTGPRCINGSQPFDGLASRLGGSSNTPRHASWNRNKLKPFWAFGPWAPLPFLMIETKTNVFFATIACTIIYWTLTMNLTLKCCVAAKISKRTPTASLGFCCCLFVFKFFLLFLMEFTGCYTKIRPKPNWRTNHE